MKNWFSKFFKETPEQGRNAVRLAFILMVAASLAVLVFGYVAVQTGVWQAYAIVAAFVGFFAFGVLVVRSARQSQFNTAGILLIVSVCYIVLAMAGLMSGIGLALSIALAVVIVEIVFETLLGPSATRAGVLGLAFAVAIFMMDRFAPWVRPSIPTVQSAVPLIAAGTVITVGFFMMARLVTWRNLNLGRKLLIAFSVLALLTLVVAVVGYRGLINERNAYESALAEGEAMALTSQIMRGDLAEMRELEKDFLLHWERQGYETAYETYIVPHAAVMANMRAKLAELPQYKPAVARELQATYPVEQFESELALMAQDLDEYELDLQLVLQAIQERGFQNTGLEGEFLEVARNLDERILNRDGLEEMAVTVLQLDRNAEELLLFGSVESVENGRELGAELKRQVSASDQLSASERNQILSLTDNYLAAFETLAAKELELAELTTALELVEEEMVPLTVDFANAGQQLAEIEIDAAHAASAQALTFSSITAVAALLVAVFLSVTLSRQITRPVTQLTAAAHELEIGNYDVQAEVTTSDELGVLAGAFNTMAARLKEAFATITKRAAELQSVAEIATQATQSTDVQEMLQAVVDLTKSSYNLYHAHIYLLDDSGTNLVLTAGAGEPGRKMVSEKRTIALDHERSLVARAARTNQGAISNDVTKEPDFLPNPLLPDTKSEMAIPVAIGDRVLGVLDVQADYVDRFSNEDISINTTLAQQVAASLESLRQFQISQKVARELGVVANVSTSTATITEVQHLLQEVVDQTKSAFSLYHTHIYLMNEANDTLVLTTGAGDIGKQMVSENRQISLDSEKSLVARAARTSAGTVVNDVHADPDFLPHPLLPETKSEQAVPMIVGDKVLGVLDVQSEILNRFSDIDVDIFTTLAAQVAVALQNARTFSQAQNQAKRETMLNAIGQKIQGATTVESVLQIAARELGRALSAPLTVAQLSMAANNGNDTDKNNGNGNDH